MVRLDLLNSNEESAPVQSPYQSFYCFGALPSEAVAARLLGLLHCFLLRDHRFVGTTDIPGRGLRPELWQPGS